MQIYLLRHGIAEDQKPGGRDEDRELTPEGKKKLQDVLRAARQAEVSPSLILTSPLRRAIQTAELAAGVLGYKDDLLRTKALEPGSSTKCVWEEVRVHKNVRELMMVGHEPLFGSLTAYLLGTPALQMDFKKGAVARVDVEQFGPEPRGVLKWYLIAKLAGRAD